MTLDRRRLFATFAAVAGAATTASPALARRAPQAEPLQPHESEIDGTALGLRPNVPDDQSKALQRAIDSAAAARAVLHLPSGRYRAGNLKLPSYTTITGIAGATQIVLAGGTGLFTATGGEHIRLSGLVLDGAAAPLPQQSGLIHFAQVRAMRIADCEIVNAGGNAIALEGAEGEVAGNTISAATTGRMLMIVWGVIVSTSSVVIRSRTTRSMR